MQAQSHHLTLAASACCPAKSQPHTVKHEHSILPSPAAGRCSLDYPHQLQHLQFPLLTELGLTTPALSLVCC